MTTIEEIYTIKAPLEKVWQALTAAEMAEAWGAGPAKVDPTEGGEFSYWDGDIHGTNTKVVPGERIEQDWYGHDYPGKKFQVTFTFESTGDGTVVHLYFAGDIVDEQKDRADWRMYYFDPIKKLLEE